MNSINIRFFCFLLKASPLISHQVRWRWSSPQSPSPHTSATLHCCAARCQATRRPLSAGRRTGRTCHWPLTLTLAWRCSRPAPCRSAVSSRRTLPRTAVWLTTPAAPGRGQTPSSVCSQVTDRTVMHCKHMAAWLIDLLDDWLTWHHTCSFGPHASNSFINKSTCLKEQLQQTVLNIQSCYNEVRHSFI